VQFFLTGNANAVAADTALAVEKGAGVPPFIVNFDLLQERYAGSFWHFGDFLSKPLIESPINYLNASK
jgi:hypothetical protein